MMRPTKPDPSSFISAECLRGVTLSFAFNDAADNGTQVGGDGSVVVYFGVPTASTTASGAAENGPVPGGGPM